MSSGAGPLFLSPSYLVREGGARLAGFWWRGWHARRESIITSRMNRRSHKQDLVIEALTQATGPMSANELWDQLRTANSGIGLATVYRALKRGVADEELVSVELQAGSVRYELANLDHHHHFICTNCDRAFDLEGCVGKIEQLAPRGFRVTNHEILLQGVCADCRRAE